MHSPVPNEVKNLMVWKKPIEERLMQFFKRDIRGHPFGTYTKVSKKPTLLSDMHTYVWVSGGNNC